MFAKIDTLRIYASSAADLNMTVSVCCEQQTQDYPRLSHNLRCELAFVQKASPNSFWVLTTGHNGKGY